MQTNPGWWFSHFDKWTWPIAHYGPAVIAVFTAVGFATPILAARRNQVRQPGPMLILNSGFKACGFSCLVVAASAMLHFIDLRWLPPSQRGHLSIGGGGILGPAVKVINTAAAAPVELHAAQVAIHFAVSCVFLALLAFLVAFLTNRRARRAEIRQMIRVELAREISAR
jgi:hypothetical protein